MKNPECATLLLLVDVTMGARDVRVSVEKIEKFRQSYFTLNVFVVMPTQQSYMDMPFSLHFIMSTLWRGKHSVKSLRSVA